MGLAEIRDSLRITRAKVNRLAEFIRDAESIVCLTGAGISTSAGIADFRGPNGVWTKEKEQKGKNKELIKEEQNSSSNEGNHAFEAAKPSKTHEILVELQRIGKVKCIISQNVDGLHLRSKFPRDSLVELHGNVFLERCIDCGFEVFHSVDVGGVGCKPTGVRCEKCNGAMHDTVLDWDTPIPDDDLARSEMEMANADLVLCLGTSLRIVPAAELPLLVGTARVDDCNPRICIVNLQKNST